MNSNLRVALPIMAVTIAACVGLYSLLTWQPNREARRGFESKALSLSRMLAHSLVATLEFEDAVAAQRALDTAKTERSISHAAVRKLDGNILASVNGALVPTVSTLFQSDVLETDIDDTHEVSVPLLSQGKVIGWLVIGFSLDEVQKAYSGTRATSLLVVFGLALVGFASAMLFGRSAANRAKLLAEISSTVKQLRGASENIKGACNEQAVGTTEQAAAVEETRQTMNSLLEAAKKISDASQDVFKNADETSRTTLAISDAIKQLTNQAQKISDISEVIRSISDKSDLLALNAALEGTKAGESGRGFTLVAAEMRRLAESVMAAAREIKELTSNIRIASDSSVKAAVDGRELAGRTSESAREITLVTGQQRTATEQVTRSMNEVSQLLARSSLSTRATENAAQALSALADQLTQLTSRFAAELERA